MNGSSPLSSVVPFTPRSPIEGLRMTAYGELNELSLLTASTLLDSALER